MTTILQISDTHIVPEGALVSGRLDTADALARLVDRINSIRDQIGPIDALLVSGDLSDDGSAESYARFKTLIAPLDLPILCHPRKPRCPRSDADRLCRRVAGKRPAELDPQGW